MLIHFKRYDPQPLIKLFESTSKNLRIRMKIKNYNMGDFDNRKSI